LLPDESDSGGSATLREITVQDVEFLFINDSIAWLNVGIDQFNYNSKGAICEVIIGMYFTAIG